MLTQTEPKLLRRDEVATRLNIHPTTVYTLHRYGQLPGKRLGRELRWSSEQVDQYLARFLADVTTQR